ncbi:hypothetical protein KVR01_006913 [Diaporthe batatas]|uniref:uncharacterized protein n=1 Tax=Diaporthe batatas TaxID=748121 RepID=UPI001D059D25|nr:uncharacterized protein KVR01_006913 [Diaporthe batatas]KAG8163616.1 hypothetical protein KVR01_006913 [Diaporthe batatas]
MCSPNSSSIAAGTPQPPSGTASRKRGADGDNTAESTAAKKAAMKARGPPTMRRSGTSSSFRGSMRPSLAAGYSSPFHQHVSLSRPVYGPGLLSQPTPANFDTPAVQSASPSLSATTLAPLANFRPSTEVRQSLSHTTSEASDSTSGLPLEVSRPVAPGVPQPPSRFIPQFGPAHRQPPRSDDEESQSSDSDDEPLACAKNQALTFEDRLRKAQENSDVWDFIVDKLEFVNFTCKGDRERQAMLEILRLPKQNELDDKPMREADRHQRRYHVIMGSILQVVGVVGHCDACGPYNRKKWEHRRKTCTGLPPEATGPEYQELVEFVAGRCSNCIRSNYRPASCHFAAGVAPTGTQAEGIPYAATNGAPGNAPPQNQEQTQNSHDPIREIDSDPRALISTPPARAPTGVEQNDDSGDVEAIFSDIILVGYRASTQLQQHEQRGFHNWLTMLLSFSSSSPDLEDQALAALARLRQLDHDVQADIRRRILQMLAGAMGRPA